jgi:hypothetical protein
LLDDWRVAGSHCVIAWVVSGLRASLRPLSDWAPPPPPPPVIKKIIQGPKTIRLDSMSLFDSGKSVLKAGSTKCW